MPFGRLGFPIGQVQEGRKNIQTRFIQVAVLILHLIVSAQAQSWRSAATSEQLQSRMQGVSWKHQLYDCNMAKIDGDWAVAFMTMRGGTDGGMLLRKAGGAWNIHAIVGGRGPISRQELLRAGMPEAYVARFGYGLVPRAVAASLVAVARTKHADSATLATYGDKYFGAISRHDGRNSHDIYEFVNGQWRYIFTHRYQPGVGYKTFTKYQFSPYMGQCIVSGTAGMLSL